MPRRVRGDARLDVGGHQRQVGGGEGAASGIPAGIAASFQLLKVGDIGEVDLGGQVPPGRRAQALVRPEGAAGQRPASLERRCAALPEQGVQAVAADLEDNSEHLMAESLLLSAVGSHCALSVACGFIPFAARDHAGRRLMCWHTRMILCCLPCFRL